MPFEVHFTIGASGRPMPIPGAPSMSSAHGGLDTPRQDVYT